MVSFRSSTVTTTLLLYLTPLCPAWSEGSSNVLGVLILLDPDGGQTRVAQTAFAARIFADSVDDSFPLILLHMIQLYLQIVTR